jgi:hypothetical protein
LALKSKGTSSRALLWLNRQFILPFAANLGRALQRIFNHRLGLHKRGHIPLSSKFKLCSVFLDFYGFECGSFSYVVFEIRQD